MADQATAAGGLVQGIGGYVASRKSADTILANARREAKRIRLMGKKKVEADKTMAAGSGLTIDSFAEVLEESIANTEYNARTVLLQAQQKAKKVKQAGKMALLSSAVTFGLTPGAGALFNFASSSISNSDAEAGATSYGMVPPKKDNK